MACFNRTASLLACAMLTALAPAVAAQEQPIPPEHYTLDSRGVDLVSGSFNYGTTEVVIGQLGAGGLAYGRVWTNNGWRDSLIGGISFQPDEMIVSVGPISELFVPDSSTGLTWVSKYGNGSTVVMDVGSTTITDRFGNVTIFESPMGLSPDDNPYGATGGLPTSVTSPDGSVITYTYKERQKCFEYSFRNHCIDWRPIYRVSAITNNRGYMIKYAYASNDPQNAAYWRVANVRGINLAVDWCDATADSCTSFTQTWPSVSYDSAEPPTTATDQSSRVTTYGYSNSNTELATIRYPDATSDDVAVAYNASPDFRVNQVVDASGQWDYAYALVSTTQTTTVTGPLNQELVVEVDTTIGRATSVTDALSNEWAWQYDADLRVTRVTQPEGNYVEYEYDTRSNVVETKWNPKPGGSLDPIVSSTQYPALPCADIETCNKPESTTDAMGGVTDYEWDSTTGQLLSVTLPAPAVSAARPQTRYSYDTFQARYRDSASTYVNGAAISLPIGTSACITGDPQTSPTSVCTTTANEMVSAVEYPTTASPNNLLPVSTSRGSGEAPVMAEVETTWTPQGDVLTVDGPLSGTADTTAYVYDTSDPRQRIGVIGPDPDGGGALLNRAQRLTYNSRGQVTLAETGTASGGIWANFSALLKSQTTYDAAQFFRPVETRQLSAANAVAGVQQVTWDAAGRPSCVAVRLNPAEFSSLPSSACTLDTTGSFGPDRIVQTTYDDVGRPLTTTSALGTADAVTESVAYTDNGQVESLTDGNGNVSIMEYDGFDRVAKLRYPNATGGGTSTTDYEAYAFDDYGRPYSSRNRAGDLTYFDFDALGRLTAVNAPSGTQDTAFTYDNLGRTLSAELPSVQSITMVYDALNRQISEYSPTFGTVGYQYDAASRMTRITWPDAYYAAYEHDLYGAVTAIRENGASSGAGVLAQYAYSNLGQLTGITRADGAGASTTYGYDPFARLTSLVQNPDGTSNDVTLGFSYNPAGQIVGRTVSDDDYVWTPTTGSTGYTLNGLNAVTQIDSTSITYDANRNLTAGTGHTYAYDSANQLQTATDSATATFLYDANSRLLRSSGVGPTRYFLYAGVQAIAEYDDQGAVVNRYVPGLGLDEVVTSYVGSGTGSRSWLLADERGSVITLTNASGAVSAINRYDEYGVPASGNAGRFQYTGQAWLDDAGVYHYRARTYLPQFGRFLQTDLIGYQAGANLYAYVGADPINFSDPLGSTRVRVRGQLYEVCIESQTVEGPIESCSWVPLRRSSLGGGFGASGASTGGSPFGYMPGFNSVTETAEYQRLDAEVERVSAENAWMAEPILLVMPAGNLGRLRRVGSAISRVCNNCFVAGTGVLTVDGLKPIESIEVGDAVLSRDEATGETGFKLVEALIPGAERQIWELTVETVDAAGAARREVFGATDDHPWRLVGGDWAETSELYPGTELVTADGRQTIVVSVTQTERIERTYNFEVEGFHTYFVGESAVWVHNACGPRFYRGWLRKQILPPDQTTPCAYCGRPATQVDHVWPWSRGGRTTIDNAAPACISCNLSKGAKTIFEWLGF